MFQDEIDNDNDIDDDIKDHVFYCACVIMKFIMFVMKID